MPTSDPRPISALPTIGTALGWLAEQRLGPDGFRGRLDQWIARWEQDPPPGFDYWHDWAALGGWENQGLPEVEQALWARPWYRQGLGDTLAHSGHRANLARHLSGRLIMAGDQGWRRAMEAFVGALPEEDAKAFVREVADRLCNPRATIANIATDVVPRQILLSKMGLMAPAEAAFERLWRDFPHEENPVDQGHALLAIAALHPHQPPRGMDLTPDKARRLGRYLASTLPRLAHRLKKAGSGGHCAWIADHILEVAALLGRWGLSSDALDQAFEEGLEEGSPFARECLARFATDPAASQAFLARAHARHARAMDRGLPPPAPAPGKSRL